LNGERQDNAAPAATFSGQVEFMRRVLWFFFDEAIPATLARKLGAHLLTETMERRPDIGLDSYDRFFPNQDTLPPGGFGNLIALPRDPVESRPLEWPPVRVHPATGVLPCALFS